MTNKVELNTLTQVVHKEQAFLTALNENFLRLQQAINDTISRSGVVPNQMEEVLDMNGKRVINVGEAVEDTDAVTRAFIKDLIADVEAAVSRLNTLVEQAKEALALYASEYILPPAIAARDDAIEAKNAAKGYYDDTKALYDQLASLVTNLDTLLAVGSDLVNIDIVAGDLDNIDTLATISSAITTCADNIQAILAAPIYAEHAETWAEGSDEDVAALGGTHSAKGWAELAGQAVGGYTAGDGISISPSKEISTTAQAHNKLVNAVVSAEYEIEVSAWDAVTKEATVSVTDLHTTSTVWVAPKPTAANIEAYTDAKIFGSSVAEGALTLTCDTIPSDSVYVIIGVC